MEIYLPYAIWKATVIASLGLSIRCHDSGASRFLSGIDANSIIWQTAILTDGSDAASYSDYQANVAPLCNKQAGTPVQPFAVPSFDFKGGGLQFTADSNGDTVGYYKINVATTTSLSIIGGNLYTVGMKMGDTVSLSVVDKDGVYYPAGTVVKAYVTGWNVSPTGDQGINTPYGIKIPGGLYIAVKYTNTNLLTDVKVGVNFFLHQPK